MIFVNGIARNDVPANDRGLAYGDGVFRTFRVRAGAALHWRRQYAKLASDCARLGLAVPDQETLAGEIANACAGSADHVGKIIVTRGVGRRGYRYAGDEAPTRIVQAEPADESAANGQSGVAVRLCTIRLSSQSALAGVKHLNRLENVLARAEWRDPQIAEGLLQDADGNVISGTMSNLFICRDGSLITPSLAQCGVAGVTRDRVIDAAVRHDVTCSVSSITWQDVLEADEVFLVNSVFSVWPVREIDAHERVPGILTRTVQRWLNEGDDA